MNPGEQHSKYKVFQTKQQALDFQQLIADEINNGCPYQTRPLYDYSSDQYAIQLVWNFESEILKVISQQEWDEAPRLYNGGPFYSGPPKNQNKK